MSRKTSPGMMLVSLLTIQPVHAQPCDLTEDVKVTASDAAGLMATRPSSGGHEFGRSVANGVALEDNELGQARLIDNLSIHPKIPA